MVGVPASAEGAALPVPAAGPRTLVTMGLGMGHAVFGLPGSAIPGRLHSSRVDWVMRSLCSSAQGCVVVQATAAVAILTIDLALVLGDSCIWNICGG